MTILITGMTSRHCRDDRRFTFAEQLMQAHKRRGEHAVASDPPFNWAPEFINQFTQVYIGVAPITGLTANRAYGALAGIAALRDDPRLTVFIDAADTRHVAAALKSVATDPSKLVKPALHARKHFNVLATDSRKLDLLHAQVVRLIDGDWPRAVHPALPAWQPTRHLPKTSIPVCLDELWLNSSYYALGADLVTLRGARTAAWRATAPLSRWTRTRRRTLEHEVVPLSLRREQRAEVTMAILSHATGLLHGPDSGGYTTWSEAVSLALLARAPIATDWEALSRIGPAWSTLPAGIEHMSASDACELAEAQKSEYLTAAAGGIEKFFGTVLTPTVELTP